MVEPKGRESPSTIGVFLIWQQPHPIYIAELVYRARTERAVLERHREIVFQTAAFMASYATWGETWGWDYPLVAMTAARLGEPKLAVDALLRDTEKNRYHTNGHNYQRPGLTIYLPGNGGLLSAVAMMAGGWDGGPEVHAPGFPDEGWRVRHEGLNRII